MKVKVGPIITGQLLNFNELDLSELSITYSLVILKDDLQKTSKATLDGEGKFSFQLADPYPYQQLWFSIGDLYYGELMVHDSLHITADIAQLKEDTVSFFGEGIAFSGPDAQVCEMKNRLILHEREQQLDLDREINKIVHSKEWDSLTRQKLIEELKILYKELEDIHNEFISQNFSDLLWLVEDERTSRLYGNIWVLHRGLPMDSTLIKELISHTPHAVSNDGSLYYAYMAHWITTDPKTNTIRSDSATKAILANLPQRKADILKLHSLPTNSFVVEAYAKEFRPTIKTSWVREAFQRAMENSQQMVQRINKKLSDGNSQVEILPIGDRVLALDMHTSFFHSTQDSFQELYQAIRDSFPEKNLIFDIWTTWCSPCLSDMKNSKEVKKELSELPVEIIYLCVDVNSSKEDWIRLMTKLEIPGVHVFVEEELSTSILMQFDVPGFPTYLFFLRERYLCSRSNSIYV